MHCGFKCELPLWLRVNIVMKSLRSYLIETWTGGNAPQRPLYKHYFPSQSFPDFLFPKGLQGPAETAGGGITSFKVEAHLKGCCFERNSQKKRKEGVQCLCWNVWSEPFEMSCYWPILSINTIYCHCSFRISPVSKPYLVLLTRCVLTYLVIFTV